MAYVNKHELIALIFVLIVRQIFHGFSLFLLKKVMPSCLWWFRLLLICVAVIVETSLLMSLVLTVQKTNVITNEMIHWIYYAVFILEVLVAMFMLPLDYCKLV